MRTPVTLFVLAVLVRVGLVAAFPDPAYPDSFYYVDVARALHAGQGFNIDFIWTFVDIGGRIPAHPGLPIPSNGHWMPLASIVQVPTLALFGTGLLGTELPFVLIGALAAPLTWAIARDAGATPMVAAAAGVLSAVPGAATVFMAQPENFAILHTLVAATLWCAARGLRGDGLAFAFAGLLSGLASLARNDGVLLFGAVALVWLGDRWRWWRMRHGRRGWTHVEDRPPIPVIAAVLCLGLFLLVMAPWWWRQLTVFGSISPTSSNGAALWIRDIREWNSVTANPSLATFLAQGPGPILASRLAGLTGAIGNFVVFICSVVLLPFLLVGALARWRSRAFTPWFVYTAVVFAGATILYPLHVPGGAFIHSAIGLAPHAAVLSVEGILLVVSWIAGRRRRWDEGTAGQVFVWGIVALVAATAVTFGRPVQAQWDQSRQPRLALASELQRRGVPASDRLLSIDAAGMTYFTDRGGVVTPDDPIGTVEAVARAYDTRWLVLERDDVVRSLAPVLSGGARPAWIGAPVFTVASSNADGIPALALYPVCTQASDTRCR